MILEAAVIFGAFAFAHLIRFQTSILPTPIESVPLLRYMLMGAIATPLIVILHLSHGLYYQKITVSVSEEIGALLNAQLQSFFLIVLLSFFNRDFPSSRVTLLLIMLLAFLASLLIRLALRHIRYAFYKAGFAVRPVIVIGESPLGDLLVRRIERNITLGMKIKERVTLNQSNGNTLIAAVRHLIKDAFPAPVILISGGLSESELAVVIGECDRLGVDCLLPSERSAVSGLPSTVRMLEGVPILRLTTREELAWVRAKKRLFDLTIVILAAPLWLPVIALLALFSLIFQGTPVFFSHKRLGRNGRTIRTLKFRTMIRNADSVPLPIGFDDKFKSEEDPRITNWGRILRKTSLDELPQIINILIGDISLVGPRPIVENELEKYGHWSRLFLSVPPGLTGLWQVSGRSDLTYDQRVELDTYYIHNWSLALDIRILLQTLPAVLLRKGAY